MLEIIIYTLMCLGIVFVGTGLITLAEKFILGGKG